jgi:two-component system cell cycle response regulator
VLRKFKEVKSNIPIIVVTTYSSVSLAVEAMKEGAYDYITKPFNLDELRLVVLHALERQKLLEEVKEKNIYQELALIDGLTHIYNRRYFDELLRREVDRAMRYPQKFSLLMIDIDDFKKYNDTYGHLAGDRVLKGIASILFHRTRSTDFVARFGGEEFVLIAPHTDKKGASVLAARIADLVAKENFVLTDSTVTNVTVSIGVATFGDDATTKEELIQSADKALYQAKRLGKNRVCLFGVEV